MISLLPVVSYWEWLMEIHYHVVVAQDEEEIVIISVYRPDLNKFDPDFRTRRK